MKVRDLMSKPVIRIHANEPVSVAARTLTHYNIGALPVCGTDGKICGVLTDRDIVTRCLAANRDLERTTVGDVMTQAVQSVDADADASLAAHIMANCEENVFDAADALTEITSNISSR